MEQKQKKDRKEEIECMKGDICEVKVVGTDLYESNLLRVAEGKRRAYKYSFLIQAILRRDSECPSDAMSVFMRFFNQELKIGNLEADKAKVMMNFLEKENATNALCYGAVIWDDGSKNEEVNLMKPVNPDAAEFYVALSLAWPPQMT